MKPFFLFIGMLLTNFSFAREAVLRGHIADAGNKEKIEFASIVLKRAGDTTILTGTKSKVDGSFALQQLPFGQYTITFSSIGYDSKTLKNFVLDKDTVELGNVWLSANSKTLKNVNFVLEKADIELGIDKKTFNVDKNITAAGGTAADIMRNIPSVNVDMDGNISLRGKDNVTLLVDGKPSAMFGNDAATALQTIPAASIESVEVITNPSSKYEAQGMNGIINIIMKKDRKAGFNGMLNAGIASPFKLNGGLNVNVKKGKWNVFLNANGRTSRTWEETTTSRDNYENDITYSSFAHNNRRPLSGFANIGADYSFNTKNKITLTQSIFNANMKGEVTTDIHNQHSYATPISSQHRVNAYTGQPLSATTNLQFKHSFARPREELNVELNYSTSRYKRTSSFSTGLYDSLGQLYNSFVQKNPISGKNWNGTLQIDYTRPVGKSGRVELGERSYQMEFKSENFPTIQYQNQPEQEEAILKNHFIFAQQVHGVYANYANQFHKTGVQVGLRGEYFAYDGTIYQYNAQVTNSFASLFPTLFISQKLTKTSDLNMNYARRVNRPNFYQLIPYLDVSNPQDTSQGNPALQPEFTHAMEMSYSNQYDKNNSFIGSVYYQYTNNLIQRYKRFNADGTTYSQNRNLATGITYGVELTNKMNLLSWWDATINVNIFRNQINGANIDVNTIRKGYGGFAKLTTNTKLKHGFSTQFTANYFAATVVSQGEIQPYGNIDFALKKTFFSNLATLTLNVNDVLNTLQTRTVYNLYPYYNQSVLRKNQTHSIGINLQIRFADRKQLKSMEAAKKPTQAKKEMNDSKPGKSKESKNRDENLKKDEGGDDNGGGNRGNENNR